MLVRGRTYQCPSIPGIQVIDTTGGGNSSSGAVLYACCEGYEPQMAGCMGSAGCGRNYCAVRYTPAFYKRNNRACISTGKSIM